MQLVDIIALASVIGRSPDIPGLGIVPAIAVAVSAAAVLVVVMHALRQPALLAYISAGLALGAFVHPLLGSSVSEMEEISHLGLVFLLFIIGLEMDLRGMFRLGTRVALAMLLQAPVAAAVAWLVFAAIEGASWAIPGLEITSSARLYFAIATAFGSTAVVVKLLADKFELGGQAGRITVLTLIAEDVWAVLALSFLMTRGAAAGHGAPNPLLLLGGAAAAAAAMFYFVRFILARVLSSLARSPELIGVVALGWCFTCAQIFQMIGLSAEMGSLVAGLTLGPLPQAAEVFSKVSSLRDFFLALFFVALGISLPAPSWEFVIGAMVLTVIVFLSRLLLFGPALIAAGLGPIVSITSAVNLAQLSEFTLLLLPIGISQGALTRESASVISYALMFSVVISTYSIRYNHQISTWASSLLTRGRLVGYPADGQGMQGQQDKPEIIFLGFFTHADSLAKWVAEQRKDLLPRILVIDFNLKNHARIRKYGIRVAYGDVSNTETLRHHGIQNAKVVVSTISDSYLRGTSNRKLLAQIRLLNPDALFIGTAATEEKVHELRQHGAYACISPPDQCAPAYLEAICRAIDAA